MPLKMQNEINPKIVTVTTPDGHTVAWIPHPMFDSVEEPDILKPHSISLPGQRVSIKISEQYYQELLDLRLSKLVIGETGKPVELDSDTNKFELVGVSAQEDFFENVYEAILQRTDDLPFRSPVTNLRRNPFSFHMTSSQGIPIPDPANILKIKSSPD